MDINYSLWKKEHGPFLKSLPKKNVILMFSGGKDSSLALDLIVKAREEFGFDFEAHGGAYPVHRYTDSEKKRVESYWDKRGVNIIWHNPGETDDYIKNEINPCLSCQQLRRRMLKTILAGSINDWEELVLITSYTLWDIVSYSLEHILSDIFSNSNPGMGAEKVTRFQQTAQRFYPLIKMKEGYTVFRPLIKYNGNDILKVVSREGIPSLSIPCKFKDYRPKRILEKYYEKMGVSFSYKQVFGFARKALDLPDISSYTAIAKEEYLGRVF